MADTPPLLTTDVAVFAAALPSGGRLLGLGSADAAQIATTFRPTLERVAELTGETVDLSILRAGQMWFIDQIESGHRLRAVSAVGDRFPLHDTANEVLKHVARLWGFGVQMESVNAAGDVSKRWSVPAPAA